MMLLASAVDSKALKLFPERLAGLASGMNIDVLRANSHVPRAQVKTPGSITQKLRGRTEVLHHTNST